MTVRLDSDPRRALPGVDHLLRSIAVAPLIGLYGSDLVTVQARLVLARVRAEIVAGAPPPAEETLVAELAQALARTFGGKLRRVLNLTGVLLHTNLGRAALPRAVADELADRLTAGCDLELDLATGRRGERNRRARALLTALTGAADALVVNNNAAALVLAVAALAKDREVVVSRGQLVEIGGSFRIPEILATAGARLVEVGTTNRTRLEDYSQAIGEGTGLVLVVFPSNYAIRGFTASVEPGALAALAAQRGVPLLVDEGSGLLRAHPAAALADHPSFEQLLATGCDLVCGSGDKLLGGPQAGLLVGRQALVERCRRHPLYRALRPDRLTFAALEAVLRLHAGGGAGPSSLPLAGLWPPPTVHRRRLERVLDAVRDVVPTMIIRPGAAFVGGGSAPDREIPGEVLSCEDRSGRLLALLRTADPAVMGYVRDGFLNLDLRTLDPIDDPTLVAALRGLSLAPSAPATAGGEVDVE